MRRMPKTIDSCTPPPFCTHEGSMTTFTLNVEDLTLIEGYSDCNHQVSTHFLLQLGSSIKYVRKIFWKTSISNTLIRTRTCAYQGVRNISFSENFTYELSSKLILNWNITNILTPLLFSQNWQKQPVGTCSSKYLCKNFAIFTGKHPRWSLFLVKLQGY